MSSTSLVGYAGGGGLLNPFSGILVDAFASDYSRSILEVHTLREEFEFANHSSVPGLPSKMIS